jgi:hypothetical protein
MAQFGRNRSARRASVVSLCLAFGVASSPLGRAAASAAQTEPTRLEPGIPIAQSVAAGETHAYQVALKANQVLHVVARQLGADIVLTLRGRDGESVVEMDTPTGTEEAESIWFVAPGSGEFRVEVRSFEGSAGRYELLAEPLREATPDDARRLQLQALFLEARRLERVRNSDAQQAATRNFKEAASLARTLGDRDTVRNSVRLLAQIDAGAALESLGLPSLPGKVAARYSRGFEQRAATLLEPVTKAAEFFERRLGVRPKIYLAVLARNDWRDIVSNPYGMPNSLTSRSGAGFLCLPATLEAFDELGRALKPTLSDAASKAIDSSGLSFEDGMREFADGIMFHELGHLYAAAYGIRIPNHWVDEFLANYLARAYTSEHPGSPQFEKFREIVSAAVVNGPRPKYTSLEDFERLYIGVGFQNYAWYQRQLTQRAEEVYEVKGLDLVKEVKAAFAGAEKPPASVEVSLEVLEKISPGFIDWARQLSTGAR